MIYIDPVSLRQEDVFKLVKEGDKTYLTPLVKIKESKPKKVREKTLRQLPTKTVFVKSKHPHLRTKQHYKPKVDQHSDLRQIDKLLEAEKPDFERINKFVSSLPESVDKGKFLVTLSNYKTNLLKHDGTLNNLDINKKIAGKTLLEHLAPLYGDEHDLFFRKYLSDRLDLSKVDTKKLTPGQKDSLFGLIVDRAKTLPIEDRNKYLDLALSKIIDGGFLVRRFKEFKKSKTEPSAFLEGTTANLTTSLDFVLQHYSDTDKLSKSLTKILEKADPDNKLTSELLTNLLAGSRNPNKMFRLLDRMGKLDPRLKQDYKKTAGHLLDAWKLSTLEGLGTLVRRSVRSVLNGKHNSDFQDSYHRLNHYHIQELDRDKIPDTVKHGILYLNQVTKALLHENPIKSDLYRGLKKVWLDKNKLAKKVIKPTVSSATLSLDVAERFSRTSLQPRDITWHKTSDLKDPTLDLDPSIKPYVKEVGFGDGIILKYDTQKLIEDGKVLAITTDQAINFYERHGIQSEQAKQFAFEGEVILTI